ncbi:NAD(P)-dependent alcohol dehydrogenase [Pseudomaricurvus sp. HS19]|uniref:zinc-dependent alcohol dehydrogenase family protein n=1 Tax=Pseudomaricurvus sp. HS19 TaxID=2692626 RepID=UPI00136EF898|nr:NAD(P)-dependent alcohol dehydrogenase [Pseudomaricurvus sp. HS19]MYM61930.1 zinc-binding dehydrogenase [Pseudomaricurvus sp. HS19]
MNTVRLHQPASVDNLRLCSSQAPAPGRGEISVRVRAASLNFRDSLVVNGFFPVRDGLIPLSDAAGEVIAVGDAVTEFKTGDRVISTFHPTWPDGHIERSQLTASPGGPADGFACETVTRPATHFTAAPTNLDYAQAATLTCAGVTAWRAVVTDAGTKPGDVVVIQGTGGVSLFALQFAKACGATVIATSSSADKLQRLHELGADHVINYKEQENWAEAVVGLSGGRGADLVVEVGGPNTMAQSLQAARTGAHIAIIGAVGGFEIDTIPFAIVQAKRLRLQGVTVGSRADQSAMVRAIETNNIVPVIDSHYPLSRLGEAFAALQAGGHVGKIVIDI